MNGPARVLLLCGLLSAVLHTLLFAAAPAEERKPEQIQPRRPGSVLLVQPQGIAEIPSGRPGGAAAPVAASAEPAPTAVEPVPTEPGPTAVADALGDGDYVPRPLLSVAPQPQQPVMLTWPDFDGAKLRYEGVLALYIDDQGIVQRIRTMEGDLPPALEAQARAAFTGIRFAPGELDGVAVRSRVLVEVVFEKPEPPPPVERGQRR